ncbi:MAG: PBP1A family penicillin-binding protein [Chloracidobacterium sp.]
MTGHNPAFKNDPRVFRAKRWWQRLITPRRIFFLALALLPVIALLIYYYVVFSTMIDNKLRGESFVRASGIYAAPVRVVKGGPFGKTQILDYLARVGYVAQSQGSDTNRGRYALDGNRLDITPSADAQLSGGTFSKVRIRFNGNTPAVISDLSTQRELTECLLEPPLLTSLNKEREKRKIVEFNDLPRHLVNAIVAVEDRRFFDHPGIDFRGLFRAIYRNFFERDGGLQGGSTITQQLVKNFFLTPERTLSRKLKEAYIAIILETRLTKQQIFQMYCNEIYLGQDGSYSINGVGEAARFYFGKDLVNLTLPEAAFLAGVIRGPGYYSPFKHPERMLERRNKVLGDMLEVGFISQAEYEKAKAAPLGVAPRRAASNADAPYYLDYLQTILAERKLDNVLSDPAARIYTTLDINLQQAAVEAVQDGVANLVKKPAPGLDAALVALDARTGDILAMVGGRDYSQSQLNRVTEARRQPGSVFKPFVYTAAIEEEVVTPSSLFKDEKRTFTYGNNQTYSPDNFGQAYSNRSVTVRTALTKSLNVVTVSVAVAVGYDRVARTAERFGLPRPEAYPSLALGTKEATPLEVARAYTAFPNRGMRVEPRALTLISDGKGNLVENVEPHATRVTSPAVAAVMTHLLRGPIERGTATKAKGLTKALAGKTGTSRDGWFAGFTPHLVCVVYVGYDDNRQLGITGGSSALPIFINFLRAALKFRPDLAGEAFPEAEGVEKVTVDLQTGLLPSPACQGETIEEWFLAGTAPQKDCTQATVDEMDAPGLITEPDVKLPLPEPPPPARPERLPAREPRPPATQGRD